MATSSPSKTVTAIVELELEVPKKATLTHIDDLIGGCIFGNGTNFLGKKYSYHPYTLKRSKFVIVRPYRTKFKIEDRTGSVLKRCEHILRNYKLLGH